MAGVRRWPMVMMLMVGLALAAIFGVRAWNQSQYASRVARGEARVDTLRGWMTLPYIARVHGVPEADLRALLGLPAQGDDARSLRQWFEITGTETAAGRRAVESLILERNKVTPDSPP